MLHEILIGASLSIVTINYIQFELLRGEGISLGGTVVGFQISNLGLLWSPALWHGCLTKGLRGRRIRFIYDSLVGSGWHCRSFLSYINVAYCWMVGRSLWQINLPADSNTVVNPTTNNARYFFPWK